MTHIYIKNYAPCALNEKYKTEHQLGLSLLSQGLLELHHIDIPAEELSKHLDQNEYGKPFLKNQPEIIFNISHCDGLAACGFSDCPIGIDMERVGQFKESIIRKLLTENEKTFLSHYKETPDKYQEFFYRFWTLKESRIKQAGMGFSMPLQSFSFSFDTDKTPIKISCSDENLYFHQELIDQNCMLAICSAKPVAPIYIHWK